MLRREGNLAIFDNPDAVQQETGWTVPPTLTGPQAVETGAAMLDNVDAIARQVGDGRDEHGGHYTQEELELQDRARRLAGVAHRIFATFPLEREQFLIEERYRRRATQ